METFLVVLVLAIFPYTGDPAGDVKNLVLSWAACMLGGGWLWVSWRGRLAARRPPYFLPVLASFLLLNLIAALRSEYPGYSLIEMRRYFELFLLYLVAGQVYRTTDQVRRLMLVLCGAMLVSVAYALLQKFGLDFFPWGARTSDEYLNLPATFGNPNYAAHALILVVIMAVYLGLKKGRAWQLGFALAFLLHLYFTRQRTGIVALIGALVLVSVAVLMRRAIKKPAKAAAVSLAVTAVIGVMGLAGVMAFMKVRTGSAYPLDLSLLVRYKSYCSASRMILDRPLLGHGPGVYKIEYPRFWTPYEQDWFAQERKMNTHVHNDALEIACDAGLPAAGVYLGFLILGMGYGILMGYTRRNPAARRMGYAFVALFAAFSVDGCFGFNLRVPVSAAILFVMAGAMEGMALSLTRPPRESWRPVRALSWRAAVAVLALYCAVAEARVFVSEMSLQQGKGLTFHRDLEAAKAAYARGESLAPWNWRFALQLGLINLAQKDLNAAADHLERSLLRNPVSIVTLTPLAQTKMALGVRELSEAASRGQAADWVPALDDAQKYAERALELSPKFAPAEEVLGRLFVFRAMHLAKRADGGGASGEVIRAAWQEGDAHLARAIEYGAPKQAELYRLKSRARLGMADTDGAEKAMVRSAQADPADPQAWASFYQFAQSHGRFAALRSTLLGQIQRMNETPRFGPEAAAGAYICLAKTYEAGYGDLDAAERTLREAVRRAPLRPDVWGAYAVFADRAGRMDRFLAVLMSSRKGLIDENVEPPPQVEAVALVIERGAAAVTDAAKRLLNAMNARPGGGPATGTAAEFGWAAKIVLAEARKAFPTAPQETAPGLLSLAILLAGAGDIQTAEQLCRDAMPHLSPEDQAICAQHWALLLARMRRAPEAIALLQGQLAHNPDNIGINLALAQAYAISNMNDKAKVQYQRLLDMPGSTAEVRRVVEGELRRLGPAQ
jgi:O-antigen ligase/tetratricopeptide (TPR) repeat protein